MKYINKISTGISSSAGVFAFAIAFLILTFAGYNIFLTGTTFVTYYSHIIKIWAVLIIITSIFNRKVYKLDICTILALIFILIFICSCFISKDYGGLSNNLKGIFWILAELLVLFLLIRNKNDKKWLNRFLRIFIILSSIYAVISLSFAIIGYLYVPPLIGNNFYWCGMAMGRLYGFYTDPNYGGIVASLTIFALIYLCSQNRTLWKTILTIILCVIQLSFISLSGSRTTIVACIASLIIFWILFAIYKITHNKKQWALNIIKYILIAFISCIIFFLSVTAISIAYEQTEPYILKALNGPISDPAQLFPRQFANKVCTVCEISPINDEDAHYTKVSDETDKYVVNTEHIGLMARDEGSDISNNRFDLWKSAIEIWKTSPIIGVGHNNILNYAKEKLPDCRLSQMNQTTSHNLIFDILASHGIIGLIIFISLLIVCAIQYLKYLISSKNKSGFQSCILGSMICLIFISSMFYPEILYANTIASVVFWYTLGHLRTMETYAIKTYKIHRKQK